MPKITRAEFLRWVATIAGGAAAAAVLQACGVAVENISPTDSPTASPPPATPTARGVTVASGADAGSAAQDAASAGNGETPTAEPTAETTAPTVRTQAPHIAVAHGGDDPEALVRAALLALGGMQRFVPSGATVVIKPNICNAYNSYEYASTTNPWVVGALVKMCREAGAGKVKVLDFPFSGSSVDAYKSSGIQQQVEAAGGTMVPISPRKFIPTTIPNATGLTNCSIYEDVLKADVLIDVPVAKQHSMSRLTLGMKNLMGVIEYRDIVHSDFETMLSELTGFLKPALTVVDAVRMLMRNGPTGGSLSDVKKMDTVVASADVVSADAYTAVHLFGLNVADEVWYIQRAHDIKLGRADVENLQILDIPVG
jgi:uncharacterized protein (DUF362 family)